MTQSDKQGLEAKNKVIDVINHLNQQWENRFTLDNPRLVENYLEGKTHFLVVFENLAEPKNQFVALVKRALPIGGVGDDVEVKKLTKIDIVGNGKALISQHACGESAPDKSRHGHTSNSRTDCYQETVLVDIVKLVNFPEQIVPSLVRFGIVDCIYRRLRHALYFSFTRGFVFRGAVRVDYGETDLLLFSLAKDNALLSASDFHQMPSEMVKGAPHLLDGFPCEQRDRGNHGLDTSEIMMRVPGKLRMWLDANFIRLTVEKGSDPRFQILDVLVGPCDLHTDQGDSLVCG